MRVMSFVTAPDGVRLHYELEGEGPPLLLHLGAGCDSDLWRAAGYIEPLAKKFQCILLDHRGQGASNRPREARKPHRSIRRRRRRPARPPAPGLRALLG